MLAGEGPLTPAEPRCQWPGPSQSKASGNSSPCCRQSSAPRLWGQEDALLAPLGHVSPSTSHPNSMLKSQRIHALGRKRTDT